MKMQMQRDCEFVAKCGLSWMFVEGVPQEIPQKLVSEAMQVGAFLVQDPDGAGAAELARVEADKAAVDSRVPTIEAAIRKMVARNQRGDFTAGGRPNLNALFRESGIQVDPKELDPIWNELRKEFE